MTDLRAKASRVLIAAAMISAVCTTGALALPKTYELKATPETVEWGHYDFAAKPAVTVKSGDTVVIHTLLTSNATTLERNGVKPEEVEQALRDIYAKVTDKGPGGHILTGPVFVEGAEPGDTLEVRILKIDLAIPYAYNGFGYGAGILSDDYPYRRTKIIRLDARTMTADFAPGVRIPLHPFFGSMGVAPPKDIGRYDSTPPTFIGGNMDNKALVAGSSVFFPVFASGGLFEVGDGHANQGDGEVDITAIETSLIGTFQFILHKDTGQAYPRAETPTHYISMGFDDDLSIAAHKAVREMVAFLVAEKHMSKDDAYMLASVAGDLHVTEVVDRNKGMHMMLPKAVFVGK